jgi:thioester reductase-like protein
MGRILDSLSERGLLLDEESKSKIVAWTAEFHEINLGLDSKRKELLRQEVGCIIHLAWPVNFNIGIASFEPHLKGLQNLLSLSMSIQPKPARFFFASSVSTAMRTPGPALIHDGPIKSLAQASPMGYAQSKLVAEHIVLNAARKGAHAYIFRIGQIVGDLEHGVWNDVEFVPSIIRSALSLGVLPKLTDECSWIPVDTLATAILEIDQTVKTSGRKHENLEQHVFYNMVNPRTFGWEEVIEKLRETGLRFETVGVEDWVRKLQEAAGKDDRNEEVRNPAVKLIHQIELRFLNNTFASTGHVRFDTKALERDSQALRSPPDIIGEGYIQKFVTMWMKKWQPAMSVHVDVSTP